MERWEIGDEIHQFYVDQARKEVEGDLRAKSFIPDNLKQHKFAITITLEGVGTVSAAVEASNADWQIRQLFIALGQMEKG